MAAIVSAQIRDESITGTDIQNGSIGEVDLAPEVQAKLNQTQTGSGATTKLSVQDTRSAVTTPDTYNIGGIGFHLKYNATDGLNDGGAYHGVIGGRPWGDPSGGQAFELATTDNGNLWYRSGATTAWNTWRQLQQAPEWGPVITDYGTTLEIGKAYRIDPTSAGEAEAYLPSITPAMYGQTIRIMKFSPGQDSVVLVTNGQPIRYTDFNGNDGINYDGSLLTGPYAMVALTASPDGWLVTEHHAPVVQGLMWNAVPRGYGSMLRSSQLAVEDDGRMRTVGGNVSATGAFDLQTARTNGTYFAAGPYSGIYGGQNNKTGASANYAGILGGSSNTANGYASATVGGQANQATGGLSAILGGSNNVASGYSTQVFGYGNQATQNYSAALGGQNNSAYGSFAATVGGYNNQAKGSSSLAHGNSAIASRNGERAYANGLYTTAGDSQGTESVHYGTTGGGLGEGNLLGQNNFTVPLVNTAIAFEMQIVAANSTDTARLTVEGLIRRIGTGTSQFIGTPTVTRTHASSGASTWTVTPTLSNVAGQPSILGLNGKATANVITRWVTTIRTSELL